MAEIWGIHATEEACEIAMRAPGAARVAVDEVMIRGSLPADLRAAIERVDPGALIRRSDEGWAEIVLRRGDARDVLAGLSELDVPESGFVQGDVAGVGVRVAAEGERVTLVVPAPFEAHVRRRVEEVRRS